MSDVPPEARSVQSEASFACQGLGHVRPVRPLVNPSSLLRRTVLHIQPPARLSAVCIDLETTGFSAKHGGIVSIGAVELRWDGVQLQQWVLGSRSFSRVVRPSMKSDRRAEAVHGLSGEVLRAAPPIEDVIPDFAAFLSQITDGASALKAGDTESDGADGVKCVLGTRTESPRRGTLRLPPIIAHNAIFDAQFLQRQMLSAGWQVIWDEESPLTCTRSMFRALYPHQTADLSRACRFCGIDASQRDSRHDALHDAQLCGRLFLSLADKWHST